MAGFRFSRRKVCSFALHDLDLLMLETFPDAYKALPTGAKGPQSPDYEATQELTAERALGAGGFGVALYTGRAEMELFPWYAYLFLGDRGKPAVHLGALAELDDKTLSDGCPPVLRRLIERVQERLSARVE